MTATISRLSSLAWQEVGPDVRGASLDDPAHAGDEDMRTEVLQLGAHGRVELAPVAGSDRYLFVLSGRARLSDGRRRSDLGPRTFAALDDTQRATLEGTDAPDTLILSVLAPAPGAPHSLPGARTGGTVLDIAEQPVVEEPASGKRRVYLATETTTGSKRAHGMVVTYRADTVTPMHHHPNASSLFVFLDGSGVVVANGREIPVDPGVAIRYGRGDRHALRCADGRGMRFLEFHIPGAYETISG
ncbi:MAG TPA: cupin domain-containing protein [bacterium]|nr:cupin domain-containing protein [bacterium]